MPLKERTKLNKKYLKKKQDANSISMASFIVTVTLLKCYYFLKYKRKKQKN